MNSPQQIAKHLRQLYFGGNWTCTNFKDTLENVSWQEAQTTVYSLNSIITLVYHIHYYVGVLTRVLQGKALRGDDKESFEHPPLQSQYDWDILLPKLWEEVENLAVLIEQVPEEKLWDIFSEEKYNIYYRHLFGIVEHGHYHLGQIALIKKLIKAGV
ncbi:MAG: DUF1572 domain-containing protein [Bacteroidia bacterium]|nr:DUF1572 domain-containing protein [Bacteroidia bacterium]